MSEPVVMSGVMSVNPIAAPRRWGRWGGVLLLSAALGLTPLGAWAHRDGMSEASVVSGLSIGVPLAALSVPVVAVGSLLVEGAVLTVSAVQALSKGTVWVLTRASDGASVVLTLSAEGVETASMAAGTVVVVTAMATGWLISAAGKALCFIPNEIGASLTYHERVTR